MSMIPSEIPKSIPDDIACPVPVDGGGGGGETPEPRYDSVIINILFTPVSSTVNNSDTGDMVRIIAYSGDTVLADHTMEFCESGVSSNHNAITGVDAFDALWNLQSLDSGATGDAYNYETDYVSTVTYTAHPGNKISVWINPSALEGERFDIVAT